jgi:hypothetical protein
MKQRYSNVLLESDARKSEPSAIKGAWIAFIQFLESRCACVVACSFEGSKAKQRVDSSWQ